MQSCILLLKMYSGIGICPDNIKQVLENTSEAKNIQNMVVKWNARLTGLRANPKNHRFARNPGLTFTGKSQKSAF